jgi:TfoX N-terminal domain
MAHDEMLEVGLRDALSRRRGVTDKRMFGGICFMLRGHMLCGIGKSGFMFRVGQEQQAEALARPGARPMEFGGRRMRGFVWVDPAACAARDLEAWIVLAEKFVATLPARDSPATTRRRQSRKSTTPARRS